MTAGLVHTVSGSVALQVEDTLRTAMADGDAGEALLSGRLTAPLAPGGLGGFDAGAAVARPDLRVVRAPAGSRPAGRTTRGRDSGDERARREEEARAAEEQRRRKVEEARRAAEEARATAEETHAAADDARRAADDVRRAADRLAARVAELTAELARTEEQASEAAAQLRQAERRARTADRAAQDAAAARDRALTRLAELQDRPIEG